MFTKDDEAIFSAYNQVLTEGVGHKTLGALAASILIALGGYGLTKGIKNAANEYIQGMPHKPTPGQGASVREIEQYLSEISKVNVKLDPIHTTALSAIKKNTVDPKIHRVVDHILERQTRM